MPDLLRILPGDREWAVFDVAASRAIERDALARHPPHALMQRAGLGVARLALAVAPHARSAWVACGPGNNGGDGLVAAAALQRGGWSVQATLAGDAARLPDDARYALQAAVDCGVAVAPQASAPADPPDCDLAIDALLGLGASRAPQGPIADAIDRLNRLTVPVLAVDLPSGLDADTGTRLGVAAVRARHTLALLTLKPGLFSADGRDHAGQVWLDTLGVDTSPWPAGACLTGAEALLAVQPPRRHASHKGSFGDAAVVGGAAGMTGAALLAARGALAAGAGRVFVGLLDAQGPGVDPLHPELMFRPAWWRSEPAALARSTVACGCGGGTAVREALPALLARCPRLVLDADALNALTGDAALRAQLDARAGRGHWTVLTPHPLEAARLLGSDATSVQADRFAAVRELAERHRCAVLLKGSGSLIAAPGLPTAINPTGNALLASGGSGDVLAGWIAGSWAAHGDATDGARTAWQVARAAAWVHGLAADRLLAGAPPPRAADWPARLREAAAQITRQPGR